MASTGALGDFAVPNVLGALLTMRTGGSDKKQAAMDYLAKFQKTVCSSPWTDYVSHDIANARL